MATDARSAAPAETDGVTVPARTHRRRAVALLAIAAFNLWVWATRILNLVRDPSDTPAVGVHAVLYTAAIALAVVLLALGWRMWRESRTRA